MKFIGITRGKRFSPNMSDNDMAIMREVGKRLNDQSHEVRLVSEDDYLELEQLCQFMPDAVFTMLRGNEGVNCLRRLESQGIPTLNCADAIENAHRSRISRILYDNGLPIPKTVILDEKTFKYDNHRLIQLIRGINTPCWIKNGQGWAQTDEDVVFSETHNEVMKTIRRKHERNLNAEIIVCEHLYGDLVKFYGVEKTDFFSWNYPDLNHSKFGLEIINGRPARFKFNEMELKKVCDIIASLSGVYVYGGDCVVDAGGNFKIIDFNDWPSFSSCRDYAAVAITRRILHLIHQPH